MAEHFANCGGRGPTVATWSLQRQRSQRFSQIGVYIHNRQLLPLRSQTTVGETPRSGGTDRHVGGDPGQTEATEVPLRTYNRSHRRTGNTYEYIPEVYTSVIPSQLNECEVSV